MRALITNDDGIHADGLHLLADITSEIADVVVCAPSEERSACSHGMTLRDPLRAKRVLPEKPYEVWSVNGLPVDCVNLAVSHLCDGKPDLVLSGINDGPNLGWDVTYSGTVGGAFEGAINGVRSMAISVAKFHEDAPPHLETAAKWLREYLPKLVDAPQTVHTIFNVNIPSIAPLAVRGTRVTRMGTRVYQDRVEKRDDPWGRPYYWQGGVVVMDSLEEGSDVQAVNDGFVSVTPVTLDWTHRTALDALEEAIVPHLHERHAAAE